MVSNNLLQSEESPGAGHVRLTVWDRITYVSLGRYGVRGEFSSVLLQGRPGDYSFVVAPYAWNHLCLTWSRSEQLVVALVRHLHLFQRGRFATFLSEWEASRGGYEAGRPCQFQHACPDPGRGLPDDVGRRRRPTNQQQVDQSRGSGLGL